MEKNQTLKKEEIIYKLCDIFGFDDKDRIRQYLDTKPRRLLFGLGMTDKHSFPILWQSSKIFQRIDSNNILVITNQIKGEYWVESVAKRLAVSITNVDSGDKIYGVGNWSPSSSIGHSVLEIEGTELSEVIEKYADGESYFFPYDLKWILAITHEDLSFIVGSKKFIDKIKENFADYKKYEPQYWKEILGFN